MGQVRGFTDILYPQNMAVNGSFRINQRGLFQEMWLPVKLGDVVADAWHCDLNTIDTLYCRNDASRRYDGWSLRRDGIVFYGAGKKGQTFSIASVDIHQPASLRPSLAPNAFFYTATVRARVNTLIDSVELQKSVPVSVSVFGPRNSNFYDVVYPNTTTVTVSSSENNGNTIKQAVSTYYSGNNYFSFLKPSIQITLLADGEFHVVLSDFALYPGLLTNPPQAAEVPLADDLLRCKRYYQKRTENIYALGADANGIEYILANTVNFEVEMAGTPTISLSPVYVKEEGNPANLMANYNNFANTVTPKNFFTGAAKVIGGSKPSSFGFDWTATF